MSTRPLGGFVGEWWVAPTFEVYGNSERVTLKAATLHTSQGEYPGTVSPTANTVPPGGGILTMFWEFDPQHPAPKVLGKRAEIVLDVLVGSDPRSVRVEYERVPCC